MHERKRVKTSRQAGGFTLLIIIIHKQSKYGCKDQELIKLSGR